MEQLIEHLKQGKILLIGECRGAKPEVVRYVDKKTGQASAFTSMKYMVERASGMESVQVSQFLKNEELDPSTVKVTVQKGKTYAFELSGLEARGGFLKAKMPMEAVPIPL